MKRILNVSMVAASALSLVLISSCGDRGLVRERPKDIVPTGPRAEIYEKIMAQFPEGQSIMSSQQALFEAGVTKQVILKQESPVYITFISEGASFPNTFGYYTYNSENPPTSAGQLKLEVLFPHVTDKILNQGDRLQVGEGSFPAGTVIGFFLIIKGWEQGRINFDNETFHTNMEFNPDQQQQHILFKQKDLGDIVLTFEDQLTSQSSDEDFNDIIFLVSDNSEDKPVTKFDLADVPEL